jgi:hypothetical protein
MSSRETFNWVYLLVMYVCISWMCVRWSRYWYKRYCSRRWPIANATIQRAGIELIYVGRGGSIHGSFFGYIFIVAGVQHVGMFIMTGNVARITAMQNDLSGKIIEIRYDPDDPNTSFVAHRYDLIFQSLHVTQNPDWLQCAPEISIRDVMKK